MRERTPQPEPDPDSAERAKRTATPAVEGVMRLQRSAGNAAVAAMLARVVVAPGPAAVHHTKAELEAMTLGEFHAHAQAQADWASEPHRPVATPAMAPDEVAKLRSLLEFARQDDGGKQPILAGCRGMLVSALLATGLDATTRDVLRRYGRSVARIGVTLELTRTDDVAKALDYGKALEKLDKVPGVGVTRTIFKQTEGADQLGDLIAKGWVDDFIGYVTTCSPLLEADNGAELKSYMLLREKDKADPRDFFGALPGVRNFHRFERAALKRLQDNRAYTKKDKPLTLILHSAFDHNGAFHRDPNLTAVITDDRRLTLMIEGAESLAQVTAQIGPLAKMYGKADKLQDVMIAGHGDAQVIELAGTQDTAAMDAGVSANNASTKDSVLSATGQTGETDKLMAELMKNMASDPNARIVLNACLTASNYVDKQLDPDPDKAAAEITAAINAEPSLTTYLGKAAVAAGSKAQVRGANASFGQVGLMDPAGNLDIVPGAKAPDPLLTASKAQYIEGGNEPEGCLRAVLEIWAQDRIAKTDTAKVAIEKRLAGPDSTDWSQRIIRTLYGIVLANFENANLIRVLGDVAGKVWHLRFEKDCRVEELGVVPDAHMTTIFDGLTGSDQWAARPRIGLVVFQRWMSVDNAKRADFIARLGDPSFNCALAQQFIAWPALNLHLPAMLAPAKAAAPARGELILALLGVERDPSSPEPNSKAFLRAVVGADPGFKPAHDIEGLLGGLSTQDAVEVAIGVRAEPGSGGGGSGSGSGSGKPAPNVDLDRDGVNDFYVEPMTRQGLTSASALNVRARPGMGARIVDSVPRGETVQAIGKSGDWYAIEHDGRTRFVHSRYVGLQPTL